LTPAELAGGFALPDALPLSGLIEESCRRRLDALPPETRRLLLIAAAEPVGEPALVWRAAETLGIRTEGAPAETAGLAEFGARVRFRHPLARSAIYRAASPEDRRRAHRALAAAEHAAEGSHEVWFSTWGLVELIEAATRSGKAARAAAALPRLSETTRASGTERALGIQRAPKRSPTTGRPPSASFARRSTASAAPRIRVELARAHLLYKRCGASAGASTRASSCAPPTRCSP
jgi:hypothetical protein